MLMSYCVSLYCILIFILLLIFTNHLDVKLLGFFRLCNVSKQNNAIFLQLLVISRVHSQNLAEHRALGKLTKLQIYTEYSVHIYFITSCYPVLLESNQYWSTDSWCKWKIPLHSILKVYPNFLNF